MKSYLFFVLLSFNSISALCQIKQTDNKAVLPAPQIKRQTVHNLRQVLGRVLEEDSTDVKISFAAGSNSVDFVPLSTFNGGLLIQAQNQASGTGIPVSFLNGRTGSWSFYTNGLNRLAVGSDGYIRTSNTSLLINDAAPDDNYSINVHGNALFDSSISLGVVSDSTSFISMNMGFKSTFDDSDDTKSPYTNTPVGWAAGKKLPVLRLRHPTNVALGSSANTSTAKDFMILPYQYGMAIEYNGVVECWVGEWSIHKGDFYNDAEGQGNGWGGILWVGDDKDMGGVRATARNNLANGGNVNYGELSVEKFTGTPNGDFRMRLPSTDNQFHFVYGGRGSNNIVAKLSDKGFVIPKVSSAAAITNPEAGQLYFDSTTKELKAYNGSDWSALTNSLITGSYSVSSSGAGSVYQIPHGLGVTPAYFNVIATSVDAGGILYVTADNTYLNVYYTSPPGAGTDNLSWNWQVKK